MEGAEDSDSTIKMADRVRDSNPTIILKEDLLSSNINPILIPITKNTMLRTSNST